MCDARTVQERDLIASDNIRRKYVGETLFAQQSSQYRWHYLSQQDVDEVAILKIFDTSNNVEAKSMFVRERIRDPQ
jgi:hypothetical protein